MSEPAVSFTDPIRTVARAVIFRDDHVLMQVKARPGGVRYLTLPWGKLETGETLPDCVARECLEEVGAEVRVGRLLHVAELFRTKAGARRHQIEFLFQCDVAPSYQPRLGPHPDARQTGTIWAHPVRDGALFRPRYDLPLGAAGAETYLGLLRNEAS